MSQTESLLLRYPSIFSGFPEVAAYESTRHGGVSKAPYSSLNLGLHTDDDASAIQENRRRFFAACGFHPEQTAGSHQIHGSEVLKIDQAGYFSGFDALITNVPGILLTVTIADCTPILIYDPVRRAVAAIHAGWKGTAAGIAGKTLHAMQEHYGTVPKDCLVYIGTCIDYCDFEVDADVADHFATEHKNWNGQLGKYFVDLKAANRTLLLQVGIPEGQLASSTYSTIAHNKDYFSHRHEQGTTGRMLVAIGMRSKKALHSNANNPHPSKNLPD
ncbi:MAG: peptidoglycan editing factor PgeF [Saprospiraceae bacterium]|nr:peptidoglycan editing factor PgeF [Lewinella sp.]